MKRGDVILVRFPHPSGLRGKKRPAVIVQSNAYLETLKTLVVAEVTSNLTMRDDPACLFLDLKTTEGKATGLARDSVVSGLILVTIYADTVAETLGTLAPTLERQFNQCLATALALRSDPDGRIP